MSDKLIYEDYGIRGKLYNIYTDDGGITWYLTDTIQVLVGSDFDPVLTEEEVKQIQLLVDDYYMDDYE